MALPERYNLELIRNSSAELVYERVEGLLKRKGLCPCETCVLDLVAFALNRVTPRYSTTLLGDLHPDQLQQKQLQVEVDLAIRAGLERLREHPHHD